jgi:NAD(P)-dependent dehydrogenase (short-subunit alcohol dehydrogenase family)
MGELDGQTAWVTGAASGIGRAITLELAARGARVGTLDVDAAGARSTAAEVGGVGVGCDIADRASVDTAANELEHALGPPDMLVNAAGISYSAMVAEHDEDAWRRVLDVNLTGAFHVTRAVLGGMIERGYGRIVNIASGTGVRVSAGAAAYGSSKAGLIAFTKAVAGEGARHGVTANAVAPGLVDTAMTRRTMPTDEALQTAATASPIANPMGVVLSPDDIAHAVAFLCHPKSARITGQVLHVNAGALMP